jgi:hypothetical protein
MRGINHELGPWLRMTAPRGELRIEDAPVRRLAPLGASAHRHAFGRGTAPSSTSSPSSRDLRAFFYERS